MVQYLAKRIGRSILTLFIIVTLVFCLLRLMPNLLVRIRGMVLS